jgi:serine-type D-Ala-D-Ala carboxypeptidase (penicillin-binding protein 5/6)
MRVIDYQGIKQRQRRRAIKQRRVRRSFALLVLACFMAGYGYISYQLPLPAAAVTIEAPNSDLSTQTSIIWPGYGQAALGNPDYGILETNGMQQAAPTASVAKVMTALAVLRRKPIVKGEPTPRITIDEVDVGSYKYYQTNDGSATKVELGQEITEYQALQSVLLASSNNMSETLVRWAFGSLDAYVAYANDLANSLGMKSSFFADASGFSPRTVSTASDLVLLGLAALDQPIIMEIVAQTSAVIPVAGEIKNTNRVLGQSGIIGMKTGNTDEAGGCFMVVGQQQLGGITIKTVGVIMGATSVSRAMQDSVKLIGSAYQNYEELSVATQNTTVARYDFVWGAKNTAYLKDPVKIVGWKGSDVTLDVITEPLEASQAAGSQAGFMNIYTPIDKKTVPIHLQTNSDKPNLQWRLKRLIGLNN